MVRAADAPLHTEEEGSLVPFLSWRLPGGDWQARWQEILQREGIPAEDPDLSDTACLLLVLTDSFLWAAPAWERTRVAQALRAPAKAHSANHKLHHWALDHWHRPLVRSTMAGVIRQVTVLPSLTGSHLDASQLAVDCREAPWPVLAWCTLTSRGPGAVEVARELYGPQQWDRNLRALEENRCPW